MVTHRRTNHLAPWLLFSLCLLGHTQAEEACGRPGDVCPARASSALQKSALDAAGKEVAEEASETVNIRRHVRGGNSTTGSLTASVMVWPGSEIEKASDGFGTWVMQVPDGCLDEDVEAWATDMPEGSEALYKGQPEQGGLCIFILNGTKAHVMLLLASHEFPADVFVESDIELKSVSDMEEELDESLDEDNSLLQGGQPWGLDRIDGRGARDGKYTVPRETNDGQGVHVYIMNTGIRANHKEFGGRVVPTLDTTRNSECVCDGWNSCGYGVCADDKNGLGTHVAGIVGGKTQGVAKKATLHSVKMLSDDECGSIARFEMALNWVLQKGKSPSVVSVGANVEMRDDRGFGGTFRRSLQQASNQGITVVVAAGNTGNAHKNSACDWLPAALHTVITVGASGKNDVVSRFSNKGVCVDIFAPGEGIKVPCVNGPNCFMSETGTVVASAYVAGACALLRAANPSLNNRIIREMLLQRSTKGALTSLRGGPLPVSPNKLVYIGKDEMKARKGKGHR